MRLTILSPITSGATEQTINCMAIGFSRHVEVTVVAPAHFRPDTAFTGHLATLSTPTERRARALYWYNPANVKGVAAAIRTTRPDILHVLNGQGYLSALALPWSLPETPLVVTVHDPIAHSGSLVDSVTTTLGRKLLLARAARLHTMSQFAARQLQAQGFSPGRIVTTRHGALTDVFSRHNRPNIHRTDSILFFGRWEHYKGIDILVEALVKLKHEGLPQHCILAGPGTVPEKTWALINTHPDIFEVHNCFLPDAEVAPLFQRANRTVLPYRDATQSSLPALAQAYGHLLIASNTGAFPEDVIPQGGLLVTPGSVDSLADAIRRSVSMQPKTDTPIDYSWDTVAQQLVEAYEAVLNRNR